MNILIVEDDFRIAEIHESYLRKITVVDKVFKARLAKEAQQILIKNDIELVLVDLYLPDQMGDQLVKNLRTFFPNLDFVMITASDDSHHLKKSLDMGVFYYLIKPVTFEKFKEVIKKYENQKQMINSYEKINQDVVDSIMQKEQQASSFVEKVETPKGINLITLNNVIEMVQQFPTGLTVEEASNLLGSSRTTVRRYLEYLVSIKKMEAKINYGSVGRPERIYKHIN